MPWVIRRPNFLIMGALRGADASNQTPIYVDSHHRELSVHRETILN